MATKNWYRIDVGVVDLKAKKTYWEPIGYAYGVSAASRLRKKYKPFQTRRVIVESPIENDETESGKTPASKRIIGISREPYLGNLYQVAVYDLEDNTVERSLQHPEDILRLIHTTRNVVLVYFVDSRRGLREYKRR